MNWSSIPVKTEIFLSFEQTILARMTPKTLFNGYQGLLDQACGDRVLSQSNTHRHSVPSLRTQNVFISWFSIKEITYFRLYKWKCIENACLQDCLSQTHREIYAWIQPFPQKIKSHDTEATHDLLCVAEYHQIISQLPNLYSRISGPIPVAATLLKINQNKDICQHIINSLSDANSKSSSL